MRAPRWLIVCALAPFVMHLACSDEPGGNNSTIQCDDGRDNDGDGTKDFPADPSCDGPDDETEDGMVSPLCNDGRDNDGDGRTDFPNDPGCFAEQQDSEEDDCPDGPGCPQCANGKDDDMNGQTDFPNDVGGCTAASDVDEYTRNPIACGGGITIDTIPFTGMVTGKMLMAGAPSSLAGQCGGMGDEHVYEIRVQQPKVIVATTDLDGTTADTVLYLRTEDCINMSTEVACNDDVATADKQSTLTVSVSTPGTYYLVVDSKDSLGGTYDLSVKYYIGEGTTCLAPDECGPGLVCRVPKGETEKICTKHVCEDGVDEDDDGKTDFPNDPGCTSLIDDSETDSCPGVGPMCPECGDGADNDADGLTDFGGANPDPTCSSASSASEACVSTDGVEALTMASTTGTTVGAVNDLTVMCATTGTHTAPEKTYRLDLPAMIELVIDNVNSFSAAAALYDATCAGTALQCKAFTEKLTLTNLAAGPYYYVIDGYSTATGAYTINVSGRIQANGKCDDTPLAQAGAITCDLGYACQGTAGSKTCQPAACYDGVSNSDDDTLIDYPNDPGCDSPGDNNETDPATAPVCADGVDNDNPLDGQIDYPADYGCTAASGMSEAFCTGEVDPTAKITTKTTTGTTAGMNNNWKGTCASSSHTATDVVFALQLPVPVATLQLDTNGSAFDTTLVVKSVDCVTEIDCDDEGGTGSNSLITLTGVAPGGYAVIVDGWTSQQGAFTLNVQGTVAQGTVCNSPLFSGGTSAVLLCPAGTTCKGTPTPRCSP